LDKFDQEKAEPGFTGLRREIHLAKLAKCLVATTTATAAATTITAATTATAAATATTAATTAGRTLFTRTGDIDSQGTTVDFFAVEAFDGFLRIFRGGHGNEAEAAGATGHTIHHQVCFDDRAESREGILQVVFSHVEGKIPYKQFIAHVMYLLSD